VLTHERRLIPVAALEPDQTVDDLEEAAAAPAFRIAPFEDRQSPSSKRFSDEARPDG
jgi:hypothetical protein